MSRKWKSLILAVCAAAILVDIYLYQTLAPADKVAPVVYLRNQTASNASEELSAFRKFGVAPVVYFRNQTASNASEELSAFRKFGYASMTLMQKVNPRPLFDFTLVPWSVQQNKSMYASKSIIDKHVNWSMIVVVKSHPAHGNRRAFARKSWGSFKYLDGVRLETIFVVGRGGSDKLEMSLLEEQKRHGDILQIELDEVYESIGFKALAGMQWVSQNLPPYWMYTSADDDVVPNLTKLYKDLKRVMAAGAEKELRNDTKRSGNFWHDVIPHLPFHCGYGMGVGQKPGRKDCLKWCVDYETYSIDRYPPFCHGGWYSLPVALASSIYGVSRTLQYFRMDDVWITGLLRLVYFDHINVENHFGISKRDEMIGMWPKRPAAVVHGNEKHLVDAWKGIESKVLEEAHEYIRIAK